ncbi:hypothetical protein C8Q74DRAFT_850311 [Fomes fomentarius]|nr:hypothetical protein C8Q74DRAFT_850311 [Fomes fomentarius]
MIASCAGRKRLFRSLPPLHPPSQSAGPSSIHHVHPTNKKTAPTKYVGAHHRTRPATGDHHLPDRRNRHQIMICTIPLQA